MNDTQKGSGVYVANTTFTADLDGAEIVVHAGRDRARAGHVLVTSNPQYWDEVDGNVRFDMPAVETAEAKPPEPRRAEPTHAEPTMAELLEQARKLDVAGRSKMDQAELAAAVAKAEAKAK